MALVAWMQLALLVVAGLTGLRLCRAILQSKTAPLAQQAAVGLLDALASGSRPSGVCPLAAARARALCVSIAIPASSKRPARSRGFHQPSEGL